MVGNVMLPRYGLGYFPGSQICKAPGQRERPTCPGQSLSWCGGKKNVHGQSWNLSSSDGSPGTISCKKNYYRVHFLIQAVYDGLPSLANFPVWGKTEAPACALCSGKGSIKHIVSSLQRPLQKAAITVDTIRS